MGDNHSHLVTNLDCKEGVLLLSRINSCVLSVFGGWYGIWYCHAEQWRPILKNPILFADTQVWLNTEVLISTQNWWCGFDEGIRYAEHWNILENFSSSQEFVMSLTYLGLLKGFIPQPCYKSPQNFSRFYNHQLPNGGVYILLNTIKLIFDPSLYKGTTELRIERNRSDEINVWLDARRKIKSLRSLS